MIHFIFYIFMSVTVYEPGEFFPVIMELQSGELVSQATHKGSLVLIVEYSDNSTEETVNRLPGISGEKIYRYIGQYRRSTRVHFNMNENGVPIVYGIG